MSLDAHGNACDSHACLRSESQPSASEPPRSGRPSVTPIRRLLSWCGGYQGKVSPDAGESRPRPSVHAYTTNPLEGSESLLYLLTQGAGKPDYSSHRRCIQWLLREKVRPPHDEKARFWPALLAWLLPVALYAHQLLHQSLRYILKKHFSGLLSAAQDRRDHRRSLQLMEDAQRQLSEIMADIAPLNADKSAAMHVSLPASQTSVEPPKDGGLKP